MLALAKDLVGWMQAARESRAPTSGMHGIELYQKRLGVVGFGRIGRYTTGTDSRTPRNRSAAVPSWRSSRSSR